MISFREMLRLSSAARKIISMKTSARAMTGQWATFGKFSTIKVPCLELYSNNVSQRFMQELYGNAQTCRHCCGRRRTRHTRHRQDAPIVRHACDRSVQLWQVVGGDSFKASVGYTCRTGQCGLGFGTFGGIARCLFKFILFPSLKPQILFPIPLNSTS